MAQNAIIYARFSTADQRHGFSLERQKTLGVEFALQRGWIVEATISDEGKSAFHAANRAEGAALHQFESEARNGVHKGKVLVVENIDRLSRQGAKATAQLIWALNEQGVDVATYHDGTIYNAQNNGDMMELFSVIIKAQLAYEESLKKSQRTSETWRKRYKDIGDGNRKTMAGRAPSWVKRQGDKYVLDEQRTRVLNEIFDLYISGVGIHRIVQLLNERGEPNWAVNGKRKTDGGWYLGYVYRLLQKRAVLGEYVTLDGRTISADFFPQALTAEKFGKAQAVLSLKKSNAKRDRDKVTSILTKLVICGECGGGGAYEDKGANSFTTYTTKSGEVRKYARKWYKRLRCDKARRKHECDNNTIFDYGLIENTVLDNLAIFTINSGQLSEATQKLNETIAEIVRQVDAKKRQISNLVDALANGDSRALIERLSLLERDVAGMEIQLDQATQQRDIALSQPQKSDDAAIIKSIRAEITSDDAEIRHFARSRTNIALRRLIERIDLNPDGTFRIKVDDSMSVTFSNEGKPIGFNANGKRINAKIRDGLLTHDYEGISAALFAQTRPA